jgi:hypothetical protein
MKKRCIGGVVPRGSLIALVAAALLIGAQPAAGNVRVVAGPSRVASSMTVAPESVVASEPPVTAPATTTTVPVPPSIPPTPRLAPLAAQPAPVPPRPPVAAAGRGTWALVVGIDNYPGPYDLRFAEADARDVTDALTGVGVPRNQIILLTGAAATGPGLRAAFDWLVANAGPEALAVFFFAGHVSKQRSGSEALRLPDNGSIADTEVAARLGPLHARRAWIAVASCYGGGFTEALAPGRVLTGAAGKNEKSYETATYNRSYLVQYMIREAIIERRTAPTVQDAFAYAAARQGAEHHPVQFEMEAPPLDLRG